MYRIRKFLRLLSKFPYRKGVQQHQYLDMQKFGVNYDDFITYLVYQTNFAKDWIQGIYELLFDVQSGFTPYYNQLINQREQNIQYVIGECKKRGYLELKDNLKITCEVGRFIDFWGIKFLNEVLGEFKNITQIAIGLGAGSIITWTLSYFL